MNDRFSLLIQFDPVTWAPTVFINGATDEETAKLQEIVDKIIAAVKEDHTDAEPH